jgi:hypothetical protein
MIDLFHANTTAANSHVSALNYWNQVPDLAAVVEQVSM